MLNRKEKVVLKKNYKKTILNIISFPLYVITFLVPKKKNMIVFGSSKGYHFSDNSKYMYLYMKELERKNSRDLEFYWLTKSKILSNEYIDDERFIYMYSFKGIYTLLRAKIAVLTHSLEDLCPVLMGGKKIVQLWHGTPLKKIGHDADSWSEGSKVKIRLKKILNYLLPYLNYMKCDYLVVSSNKVVSTFVSAFKIPEEKIIVLGQPRNDTFDSLCTQSNELLRKVQGYKKVIAWLPTHRGYSKYTIVDLMKNYKFDEKKINQFLTENNYLLVIKPHFVEKGKLGEYLKGSSNILIYDEADPYPLLTKVDILITDYSSIFFDYMLTNNQIIFTPFDYQSYKEYTGLYYEYSEIASGPICYDWEQVFSSLGKEKNNNYEIIKRFFNEYDFGNCERVYNFLKKL